LVTQAGKKSAIRVTTHEVVFLIIAAAALWFAIRQPVRAYHTAAAPAPGDIYEEFEFGGATRYCKIHIPPQYDNSKAVPLVLFLHGAGGDPEIASNPYFGWSEKADREGFIVAYPGAKSDDPNDVGRWHYNVMYGKGVQSKTRDTGFLRTVIERMESRYAIDGKRIFLAGFSLGGMMAHKAGVELSDRLAAIAPVAGFAGFVTIESTGKPQPRKPERPISVIIMHGLADTTVPSDGGPVRWKKEAQLVSAQFNSPYAARYWAAVNGCAETPRQERSTTGNVVTDTWSGGVNGTEVVLCTVANCGHAWPGGVDPYAKSRQAMELSATDAIWEFFKKHPKP
jgi:polyhydroxybutyrate depolymerase